MAKRERSKEVKQEVAQEKAESAVPGTSPERGAGDELSAGAASAQDSADDESAPQTDAAAPQGPSSEELSPSRELSLQLEEARAKVDEHWDQVLRLRAEIENLQRRQQRELSNAHKYALDGFARELFGVRDSLELGVSAAQDGVVEVAKLQEGSELTLKLLTAAMEKFNIMQINPAGAKFDPDLHQAISIQESADVEPDRVVHVIQRGYLLNDRLIRPALVIVSKAPVESGEDTAAASAEDAAQSGLPEQA